MRNAFFHLNKISTTVRVDAGVLTWLKFKVKGIQRRIRAILRLAMLRKLAKR